MEISGIFIKKCVNLWKIISLSQLIVIINWDFISIKQFMKIHIKQLQILLLTISYWVLSISWTDATFFNGSIASNIVTPSSDSIIFQNDIDESSDVHALIEEHLALWTSITISPTSNTKVSIWEALIFFSHHFDEIIPESYK